MNEKDFYKVVLGVSVPLEVSKIELKIAEKEVHVYLEYRPEKTNN